MRISIRALAISSAPVLFAFATGITAAACAGQDQHVKVQPSPTVAVHPETAGSKIVNAHFVGSSACKTCHAKAYNAWKKSRMANVLQDPKQHPEAVVGDFSTPDPLRTFDLGDVAFT